MTRIRRGPRHEQPRTPSKWRVGTADVCTMVIILCRIYLPTSYNYCTTAVHDKNKITEMRVYYIRYFIFLRAKFAFT